MTYLDDPLRFLLAFTDDHHHDWMRDIILKAWWRAMWHKFHEDNLKQVCCSLCACNSTFAEACIPFLEYHILPCCLAGTMSYKKRNICNQHAWWRDLWQALLKHHWQVSSEALQVSRLSTEKLAEFKFMRKWLNALKLKAWYLKHIGSQIVAKTT